MQIYFLYCNFYVINWHNISVLNVYYYYYYYWNTENKKQMTTIPLLSAFFPLLFLFFFFFFIPVDGDCVGGFQDLRALSGPGSHLIHFQWGLSASLLVSPHTKWNSLSKAWLCMYPLTSDEARWGRRVSAEENVAVHSLLYACRGEGMFARRVKINLASTLCETVLQKQTKKPPNIYHMRDTFRHASQMHICQHAGI